MKDTVRINSDWRRAVVVWVVVVLGLLGAGEALAQPEPPHFEAIVLDTFELPPNTVWERWRPYAIADDGTVYGKVTFKRSGEKYLTFVSRPGVGTRRLLRGEPSGQEIQPVAASNYGAVLLYRGRWPQDGVYVRGLGVTLLNGLHQNTFFPNDMNNRHVFAGQVGISPNNSAVTWDQQRGFVVLGGPPNHAAVRINNRGSVIGLSSALIDGVIEQTVWRPDGRNSSFDLPTQTALSYDGFNEFDEAVGNHRRLDSTGDSRWGGWYWSEATGLVEIPFRYEYPIGGFHVRIYGISDDGWVLGHEHYRDSDDQREWYLWHVEAGFFDLDDLYDWEGTFYFPAIGSGGTVINGDGQIVITNILIGENTVSRSVFLQPIK